MKPEFFWMPRICFSPDEPPAGGTPPAEPPAGGTPPAEPPAGGTPPAEPPAAKWWEGNGLNDQQRERVTAMGLTVDDPVAAIAKLTDMEVAAARKLGKSPEQLMDRPAKDQDVAEWLRANGEMFGIPENAEGYEVNQPEDWPKDIGWDADFETEARKIAHEEGLRGPALQRFSDLYAGKMQSLMSDAENDLATASQDMHTALQTDWGSQYAAKVAQAQQAGSVAAEMAGLDSAAMEGLAAALKPKVGDAGTIKLFAAIGEMMGEDSAILPGGGNNIGTTPAEARAERAALMAPGGEYYEATAKRDQATLARLKPKMDQLTKLAAG